MANITETRKIEVIALDLECTLISNAFSQIPRPGLFEFLEFCHRSFPRLVIFTGVSEERFRKVAQFLVEESKAPSWFKDIEYINWDKKIKNLSFISGVNPQEALLIDDYEPYVYPLQKSQWIKVNGFDSPYSENDFELKRICQVLERYK